MQNLLRPGDICYVKILSLSPNGAARASLEQDSGAQAALVAIDNTTGGIKAMVGGRRFQRIEIRSRHPGFAPGRVFVQALCLHHSNR